VCPAEAIESSLEYRTEVVQSLYGQFLHRSADPGGLNAFVTFLGAGGSVEQVASVLAGSLEYYQTRGGGSDTGFIGALYQDALQRSADPSGQARFNQALSGGISRNQIAAAILASAEYHQDLVQNIYQRFLRRPADSGGLSTFANFLI
jgi:hypothetical protein